MVTKKTRDGRLVGRRPYSSLYSNTLSLILLLLDGAWSERSLNIQRESESESSSRLRIDPTHTHTNTFSYTLKLTHTPFTRVMRPQTRGQIGHAHFMDDV